MSLTRNFILFFSILAISIILMSCSGSGSDGNDDTDGDCSCTNSLVCQGGMCVCPAEITKCCVSSEDCDTGYWCSPDTNRCIKNPDTDEDFSEDGDLDSIDGNETHEDGDDTPSETSEICDGDDCETTPPTDGDCDGDDCEPPDEDDTEETTIEDGDITTGAKTLMDIYGLLNFNPLTTVQQTSSQSIKNGVDPDTNYDTKKKDALYLDGTEQVLMESKKPGCLYRFWLGMENPSNDPVGKMTIKFYFNGDSSPKISQHVSELISGNYGPFKAPLAGIVSESYYSYVPICYESGLKVTLSGRPSGYQMTYHNFATADNLVEYDETEVTEDLKEAYDHYSTRLGEDPKEDLGNKKPKYDNITIDAGTSRQVFYYKDTRMINAIKMDLGNQTQEIIDNTWIEVYYEGKTAPDVNVPLSLFFGSGFGETGFKSLLLGATESSRGDEPGYYSYFPMPFWDEIEIKLNNKSTENIQNMILEIHHGENDLPRSVGHFHADYSSQATENGKDFIMLDKIGKGQVVGVVLAMESGKDGESNPPYTQDFLYGDEKIYIDEMKTPIVHGTGTDNFINGNKFWRTGVYPVADAPGPLFSIWKNSGDPSFQFTARRFFISDKLIFNYSIKLGIEHGEKNNIDAKYRSVVFYYYSCLAGMSFNDEFDIGTSTEHIQHDYVTNEWASDPKDHQNVVGFFEGKTTTEPAESGRGVKGAGADKGNMIFDMAIDKNNMGVRLVRTLDYSVRNQDAIVSVQTSELADFIEVGNWYTAGSYKPTQPGVDPTMWKESFIDIPGSITNGYSQITIQITYAGGTEWNAYNFRTYSYLPISTLTDGPGPVTSFNYSPNGQHPKLSWSQPDGVPPASYHIYRSKSQSFKCDDSTYAGTAYALEWEETEELDAMTPYYYRLISEDCTGQKSLPSEAFPVITSAPPICFEAEDAYRADLSTPDNIGEVLVKTPGFSNDKIISFPATAKPQTLVLSHDIATGAKYRVVMKFLKSPDMAQIMILHGNTVISSEDYDAYDSSEGPSGAITVKESLDIYKGSNTFRFRVNGKNASSNGYHIGVDQICLTAVGALSK